MLVVQPTEHPILFLAGPQERRRPPNRSSRSQRCYARAIRIGVAYPRMEKLDGDLNEVVLG